ncbi:MAG: hypothetical protein ACRD2G_04045, partial [Terriglobia bacterium]
MRIPRWHLVFILLAALAIPPRAPAASPGADTGAAQSKGPFANLEFRDLGPAVAGGRVSAVEGIPGNPAIYYVGAAAGGIFKTTDGGATWKAIFTKQG